MDTIAPAIKKEQLTPPVTCIVSLPFVAVALGLNSGFVG
jgi:hypothetical protein